MPLNLTTLLHTLKGNKDKENVKNRLIIMRYYKFKYIYWKYILKDQNFFKILIIKILISF